MKIRGHFLIIYAKKTNSKMGNLVTLQKKFTSNLGQKRPDLAFELQNRHPQTEGLNMKNMPNLAHKGRF